MTTYTFCNKHETNYRIDKGCDLWYDYGEDELEYQVSRNCLPPKDHPLYQKAIEMRELSKIAGMK